MHENDAFTLFESLSQVTVQYSPFTFLSVVKQKHMICGIDPLYEAVYFLG